MIAAGPAVLAVAAFGCGSSSNSSISGGAGGATNGSGGSAASSSGGSDAASSGGSGGDAGTCQLIWDDDPCYQRDAAGQIMCDYLSVDGAVRPPPPPVVNAPNASTCFYNRRNMLGTYYCLQQPCASDSAYPSEDYVPGSCSTDNVKYCCLRPDGSEFVVYHGVCSPTVSCFATFDDFKTDCSAYSTPGTAYAGPCP